MSKGFFSVFNLMGKELLELCISKVGNSRMFYFSIASLCFDLESMLRIKKQPKYIYFHFQLEQDEMSRICVWVRASQTNLQNAIFSRWTCVGPEAGIKMHNKHARGASATHQFFFSCVFPPVSIWGPSWLYSPESFLPLFILFSRALPLSPPILLYACASLF